MAGRILILDDEEKMASLLARSLERSGYEAVPCSDPFAALEHLRRSRFDVLLTDLRMPGLDGLEILSRARVADPGIDVILMTAYASVDTVREAMKRGAVDYLEKPVSAEEDLKPLLARLLSGERRSSSSAAEIRRPAMGDAKGSLGESSSEAMKAVYRKAMKVAKSNASVLLRGESGTGKEVMADLVQANSTRVGKPYLKINCGALPENLLESELFGHVKGSFTGASGDREGMFAAADAGTLLLDEIGEITPALQVKLLRILQQGEYQRVGESQTRKVDVRILAATNRPLERMISSGEFRQDLYYRLNVVPLELPPLRERPEDFDGLLRMFMGRFGGAALRLDPAAERALRAYPWPGNIRELENAVEHCVVLADENMIRLADLPAAIQDHAWTAAPIGSNPAAAVGSASLEDIEKHCLMQALEKTNGNRTRAAGILNITRRTLGYRLRKYGLEEEVNRRYGGDEG
jgi:DNA-binding NtrC family response regulator